MSRSGKKESADLETRGLPPLPHGWCWTTIEQIAALVTKGSSPGWQGFEYVDAGILFVRSQNVRWGTLDLSEKVFLPAGFNESHRNSIVREGDILLNLVGASVGRAAIATRELDGANLNQAVAIVRLPDDAISNRLLLYFILSPHVQAHITVTKQDVARANFNLDDVRPTRVPLPPSAEQRRIVAKIEELFSDLDAGVAALARAKANLKRYRAAVLKAAVEGKLTEEWRAKNPPKEPAAKLLERILKERRQKWEEDQLAAYEANGKQPPKNWRDKYQEPAGPDTANLPALPEGWCWVAAQQVSEIQGGIQKQPKRAPKNNAFPYLRVANVHRDRLDLSEISYFELFGDELSKLRLERGDLLVVEGNGSKTEIGRSALWRGEIENCVHQNHIIRVRSQTGSPAFLNIYWNSPFGNGRIMEKAASTSGLYTLSVAKVSSLPIPLPSADEQAQISTEVEERLSILDQAVVIIDSNLKRAARLRQSILKRAFEGKLVPQDPTDEPASELLDRLRSARTSREAKAVGRSAAGTRSRCANRV